MKKKNGPSEIKFLSLLMLSLVIMYSCFVYHNYYIYNSIKLVAKKNAAIEYGSANYKVEDFIKKVDGEIVSIKSDIDTSKVGEQEMVVEVKKDNIVRDIPIIVSVIDSVAPVISLKEEKVSITQGDNIDLTSNVESIKDEVDGDISFLQDVLEDSKFYYHLDYNADEINNVGEHDITVTAKDKNGNTSSMVFKLEVVAPPKPEPVYQAPVYQAPVYSNLPANASGGDLVSIAYSLVGSPYVSGANGPSAFDCSGFVQYVYSQVGISVSRSSYTQANDGVGVSYADAQPGDILSWGHGGQVTHSALYVGNGMMVHATNPSQGVVASSVAGWESGSVDSLMAVRRIQ